MRTYLPSSARVRRPGLLARALFTLCAVAPLLAAQGCYRAEAEAGDEARAVAEALTRSVSFVNGSIANGPLPEVDDDDITLVPLESTVLMTPGQTNLMSLMPDSSDREDDPVQAVLMQFGPANRHIDVSVSTGGSSGYIALQFDVADDVCETLCNKRFSVSMRQQLRLQSGKHGRAVTRTVQLECSERGSKDRCEKTPSAGELEQRVAANLERCGLLGGPGELNVETLPCLWECLAEAECIDLDAALCGGASLEQCAPYCVEAASERFSCGSGESISAVFKCDGEDDCSDGSDERGCPSFRCDGATLPGIYRCDLRQDCSDGADEAGCLELECGDATNGTVGEDNGSEPSFPEPRDAGTPPASGGGFAGSSGGDGDGDGTPDASVAMEPATYGMACETDADCGSDAPHCELFGGVVMSCTTTCEPGTTCPPVPSFPGLTVPCGANGLCGGAP